MKKKRIIVGIIVVFIVLLQIELNQVEKWRDASTWCNIVCFPCYLRYQMQGKMEVEEETMETIGKKILYICCPYISYVNLFYTGAPFIESSNLHDIYMEARLENDENITEKMTSENEQKKEELAENIKDTQIEENPVTNKQEESAIQGPLFEVLAQNQVQQTFSVNLFDDVSALRKKFYTVDPTTQISDGRLSKEKLYDRDVSISKITEAPQILIYHTHSQEGFIDSIPGDLNTTVVGAGEFLAQILREQYGYQVMHHCGTYDVESRDYAYANAAPDIEAILEEYPSIEVVIDLHRDAVPEDCRLVTNINGIDCAQFMFFNGLSYTNKLGEIDYLKNTYIEDNLAFSFQMEMTAETYYPGITRKIYLKGYRYNMHFKGKSLLIELGAQTNSLQEIMNSCIPLANVLDQVLSGEKVPLHDS